MQGIRELCEEYIGKELYQIIISNPQKTSNISKVKIRPVMLKEAIVFQVTEYKGAHKAEASLGARIVTDLDGEVETVAGMEAAPVSYMLWHHFKQSRAVLHPNEVMRWENDTLVHDAQVECAL